MDTLKIEELEPRVVPSTLAVAVASVAPDAAVTTVPEGGATVDGHAGEADDAGPVQVV